MDEVWSGVPQASIIVYGHSDTFKYLGWPSEGCWQSSDDPAATVTRESMESALLESLRYALPFSAWSVHTGTTPIVYGERTYISEAIDAICMGTGDGEPPIAALSFLRWEDEIRLWQEVVEERLAGNPGTLRQLHQTTALLRCSARWLQRMHACEETRSNILFPGQLALAESVHPLNE